MEIRNIHSPSFSAIYIKASAMNNTQTRISNGISRAIEYTDVFNSLMDKVDLYMLPGKTKDSIVIKFMDVVSDMFYKHGRSNVQKTVYERHTDNYFNVSDEICKTLEDIANGKIKAPESTDEMILGLKTDLAKINESAYDEMLMNIAEDSQVLSKEEASDIALSIYQRGKRIGRQSQNEF